MISPASERRQNRDLVQKMFIRVCRDSGFQIEATKAAQIAAGAGGFHPLDVWLALGLDLMEQIASGTHPCLQRAEYGGSK